MRPTRQPCKTALFTTTPQSSDNRSVHYSAPCSSWFTIESQLILLIFSELRIFKHASLVLCTLSSKNTRNKSYESFLAAKNSLWASDRKDWTGFECVTTVGFSSAGSGVLPPLRAAGLALALPFGETSSSFDSSGTKTPHSFLSTRNSCSGTPSHARAGSSELVPAAASTACADFRIRRLIDTRLTATSLVDWICVALGILSKITIVDSNPRVSRCRKRSLLSIKVVPSFCIASSRVLTKACARLASSAFRLSRSVRRFGLARAGVSRASCFFRNPSEQSTSLFNSLHCLCTSCSSSPFSTRKISFNTPSAMEECWSGIPLSTSFRNSRTISSCKRRADSCIPSRKVTMKSGMPSLPGYSFLAIFSTSVTWSLNAAVSPIGPKTRNRASFRACSSSSSFSSHASSRSNPTVRGGRVYGRGTSSRNAVRNSPNTLTASAVSKNKLRSSIDRPRRRRFAPYSRGTLPCASRPATRACITATSLCNSPLADCSWEKTVLMASWALRRAAPYFRPRPHRLDSSSMACALPSSNFSNGPRSLVTPST
mmetsp:Transcript_92394/g.211483  ORF Transcript_92394/g.211483 Transcript_92394/m.211483 type:complete len:542 (+) Transcript_92394:102-1727(+)